MELEVRPNLRPYEGVVIVNADASEEDQKALFRRNKAIIEEQFGGQVNHLEAGVDRVFQTGHSGALI